MISFETSLIQPTLDAESNQPSNFNLKKANWHLFANNLAALESEANAQLEQLIHTNNYNGIALLMKEIINQAAERSIPRCKTCPRSKSWWMNELTDLRKNFHNFQRLAKKTLIPEITEQAKRARNKYFRAISQHKAQHWETFMEQAQGKTAYAAFQYSNPTHKQSPLIPTLRYTGPESSKISMASSFAEKSEALILNLFPKSNYQYHIAPTSLSQIPSVSRPKMT